MRPRAQADLRLVVQLELAALQRAAPVLGRQHARARTFSSGVKSW
jgi:hypothetical protein